jgi:hypothetical protein
VVKNVHPAICLPDEPQIFYATSCLDLLSRTARPSSFSMT